MPEQFTLLSNGIKLYCRRYGEGQPLIMIHGACVDSDFFQDAARVLSRWFSVYIYDRRGYGRSETGEDHSIAAQVSDAATLIQTIGAPCPIVAHSGGTAIAMELAARRPELVTKLLLHEPVDADSMDTDCQVKKTLDEISAVIRTGKYNKAVTLFLPLLGDRDPRTREATDEELKHMGQNCRCFMEYEFDAFLGYNADAAALQGVDTVIGIGELSCDTQRWEVAVRLAEKLSAKLLYFPGAHNGAFDLPKEFAYLTAGILTE